MTAVAPQNYLDVVAQQRVFESMAAIASGWLTLRDPGGEPESLVPQRVTSGFFNVLRVAPAIGRPFNPDDETAGRDRVAILSDSLWRRRFSADPRVVGRIIPVEDLEAGPASYEVVGVMPPGFSYPVGAARPTDVWIPYVVPPEQRIRDPHRRSSYLQVIARLKRDVSFEQARAQMQQITAALLEANPAWNKGTEMALRPLVDHFVGGRVRSWMLMLLAAVGLVLLIACANVASLLLARGSAKERDVAIRAALGASRWRLVRQLLVESLLLSMAGTVCALVFGWWAVEVLRTAMPDNVPRVTTIAMDMRVLAAAAGLSVLTGIIFGVVPAVQLSRPDLTGALKDGARTGASSARQRVRSLLIVGEVALAVILLVGAALFIGSFVSVLRIDIGFNAERLLIAQVSPRLESRTQPRNFASAFEDIVERIGRIPGVVQASMIAGGLPLSGSIGLTTITIPGRTVDLNKADRISVRRVTSKYLQTLGIPLRRGRLFTDNDRQGSLPVVIINDAAASQHFPGEDPIGREVDINGILTIVGVVGDVHQTSFELEPRAEAYVPMAQGGAPGAELAIRTSGNPYDVLPAVKTAVYGVLPDVPLRNVRTMEELIATRLAQRKLNTLLLGSFGALGLLIAIVGIYGLMAFVVSQRTREIGVRIALGASRASVVGMVLAKSLVLVASGLLAGGVAAWFLSSTARAFLFGLEPTDPRAFAAAAATLVLAALIATAIPARRAAGVNPVEALRSE
jgi:putative ABC transport system permease protein